MNRKTLTGSRFIFVALTIPTGVGPGFQKKIDELKSTAMKKKQRRKIKIETISKKTIKTPQLSVVCLAFFRGNFD